MNEQEIRLKANKDMDEAIAYLRGIHMERAQPFAKVLMKYQGDLHKLTIPGLVQRYEDALKDLTRVAQEEENLQFRFVSKDAGRNGYNFSTRFLGNLKSVLLEYMIQCFHEKTTADFGDITSAFGTVVNLGSLKLLPIQFLGRNAVVDQLATIFGASKEAAELYAEIKLAQTADPKEVFDFEDFINMLKGVGPIYKSNLLYRLKMHTAAMNKVENSSVPGRLLYADFVKQMETEVDVASAAYQRIFLQNDQQKTN